MKRLTLTIAMLLGASAPVLASNADSFKEHDPFGWMMAVTSMMVVFFALLILFICFKYGYVATSKFVHMLFINSYKQAKASKAKNNSMKVTDAQTGAAADDDELIAAIGMALFLNEDGMHDKESDILTFNDSVSGWTGVGQNQKPMPRRRW